MVLFYLLFYFIFCLLRWNRFHFWCLLTSIDFWFLLRIWPSMFDNRIPLRFDVWPPSVYAFPLRTFVLIQAFLSCRQTTVSSRCRFLCMISDGSKHFGTNLELRDGVQEKGNECISPREEKKSLHPAQHGDMCRPTGLSGPIGALDSINCSSFTAEQRK